MLGRTCSGRPGAASISLASVLAINSASADERVVKLEPLAKPGGPEGGLALVVADNWQVDLLENNLVIASSSELILPPPCGEAALAIKELLWLWKTHSVNMSLKVKVLGSVENCPVVGKVPWVELRVDVQGLNVSVLVGSGLCLVLGVPFSTSDLQLGWFLLELGSTVCSSEDDSRGDQGASALVEVHSLRFSSITRILSNGLFSEDCTHVRPLSELGLVLAESLDPDSKP